MRSPMFFELHSVLDIGRRPGAQSLVLGDTFGYVFYIMRRSD
jgi:hypothetical protein